MSHNDTVLKMMARLPRGTYRDYQQPLTEIPGAIWGFDFNEVTELPVEAIGGNDATAAVGVKQGVKSRLQLQARFNGDGGYIEYPNSPTVFDRTAWTLELLLTPGTLTESTQRILDNHTADTGIHVSLLSDGTLQAGIGDGTTTTFASVNPLTPGSEAHVVVAYSGGAVTLYVDGALHASGTKTYATNPAANGYFGAEDTGGTNPYRGTLDLARFYNFAFDQEDVDFRRLSLRNYYNSTNQRILSTIVGTDGLGYHGLTQLIDSVGLSRHIDTATSGVLDNIGRLVNVAREQSETDNDYRIRIKAGFKQASSKGTRNEIIGFVSAATFNDPSSVIVRENIDQTTGLYRPRYYTIETGIEGLVSAGLTEGPDIQAALLLVEDRLSLVEAAGVRGEFFLLGSFSYEGDDADFGPTGAGDATTGYSNDTTLYPDFGPTNEGGVWGGFSGS